MKTLINVIVSLFCAQTFLSAGNLVTYSVDGKAYEGYVSAPTKSAPLVLIVHDWDGMNEYEMKRAQMLNDMGYAVFAVDLFGKGVKPVSIDEKKALTGELYKDRAKMRKLLNAGFETAKAQGLNGNNALIIGYCFGGTAVLEMARSGANLKGFVSFHGGLVTPEGQDYALAKSPILILHGTADASVSMQEFAGLAVELEKAGVKHEMITYSGAPHAFSVFGSDRYREDADKKSWARLGAFLKEVL